MAQIDRPASDLRIVRSESFTNDEGERLVAIYSIGLDAVTFVDVAEELRLLAAGVDFIESLPVDESAEPETEA